MLRSRRLPALQETTLSRQAPPGPTTSSSLGKDDEKARRIFVTLEYRVLRDHTGEISCRFDNDLSINVEFFEKRGPYISSMRPRD